jgi:hypothetical protein
VVDVLHPQIVGLRIVLEVVVTVGQAEAALIGNRHLDRRVLEVGLRAEGVERVDADGVELGDERRELVDAGQRGDLLQQRIERTESLSVNRRFVEARSIVVADLLRLGVAARGCGVENRVERFVVALLQLLEASPAGAIRRHRVLRNPAATGELVEVGARVGAAVERVELESRRGGGGRGRSRWLLRGDARLRDGQYPGERQRNEYGS